MRTKSRGTNVDEALDQAVTQQHNDQTMRYLRQPCLLDHCFLGQTLADSALLVTHGDRTLSVIEEPGG